MKKDIIPQKIKVARLMRGLSMQALSEAMNSKVSKQAISKYEQGKMQPSLNVLESISEALNFPISYFKSTPLSICDIEFRVDNKVPKSSFDQMKAMAQMKIERYLKLENILAISTSKDNPLEKQRISSYDDVEAAAMDLRSKWHLGSFPIFSVYEVMENNGVKIIEFEAGVRDIVGFSTFANSHIPLVIVNLTANETTERKRFTALHELGHILLSFENDIDNNLKERFCSRFAGAMLCPKETIINEFGYFRNTLTLNELISLKNRYGISISAIVHRVKDLGIISEKYYNNIYNYHINKNRKEKDWGGYSIQEHTDRYSRLLQRVIAEKYLTWDEASDLLGEDLESYKKNICLL